MFISDMADKNHQKSGLMRRIKKKKKLLTSRVSYALQTEHEHYFDKDEVEEYRNRHTNNSRIDPCCKICGITLTEYRNHVRFDTLEIPIYKGGK